MKNSVISILALFGVSSLTKECQWSVNGFSISVTTNAGDLAQQRLKEALSSPSGKLTISPEIIIPEPKDPTALLLQATQVTKLSSKIRNNAKANAAFVAGSLTSLNQFVSEQEEVRGSFPGPLPVIYCGSTTTDGDSDNVEVFEALAEYGACGICKVVNSGDPVSSAQDVSADDLAWMKEALGFGIQPIPEVSLNTDKQWEESDVSDLIDALSAQCGGDDQRLVAVVFRLVPSSVEATADTDDDKDETVSSSTLNWDNVPVLPKTLTRNTLVIGSVNAGSQEDLRNYNIALKSKGFNGAYVRADCVPGFRMNPDLEFVGNFWSSVVSSLKSTRSSTFQFRSKVALEKDVPMEWYNYQKDVMESGALGDFSKQASQEDALDTANGDYKGF